MAKYDKSAELGKQFILKFIKERRAEKNITQEKLAEIIGVDKSTIFRYEKGEIDIPFLNFLKICGALELRPFLVASEADDSDYRRIYSN